jgi:hypothetical protein
MTAFKPYITGENESQLRQWLAYQFEQSSTGVAKTGVLAGLGCTPTSPSPSGSVVIGKGAAVCQPSSQAFPLVEPADETFDVFTANPMQYVNNPRNDVIVLDQVTGLVTNLVGTPNAVPSSGEQSVPATAVPLWRLRHAANATTIPASVMDDLRVPTHVGGGPTAMCVGTVAQPALVPAGSSLGPYPQTFPVGRFAIAPKLTFGVEGSRLVAFATSITTAGFNLWLRNVAASDSPSGAETITWHAVQMTPLSAAG